MTPYSLSFYVDVVSSGSVLGAKPSDSPEQVAAVLGDDFIENSAFTDSMWRDYGITEFFWGRESPEHLWVGSHFSLQVHRLASGGNKNVDRRLREKYGRFSPKLRFGRLRGLLEKRGVPLVEVPEYGGEDRTFWQPESLVAVTFISAHPDWAIRSRPSWLRIGDVYRISAPMTRESVEWRRRQAREMA